MKRILHILPTLDPCGPGHQLRLLARRLGGECQFHVCALDHGGLLAGDLAQARVPTTVLGRRTPFDPRTLLQLVRLVQEFRPDVIHTWRASSHLAGCAMSTVCGGIPVVHSQHRRERNQGAVERLACRQAARMCRRILVNDEAMRQSCVADGWPEDRIRVIPNAVVPPAADVTTRGQLLAELELPETARLVGVAGGLRYEKRIKDAIWATDLLKVIRDDVYLLVAGEGDHFERLYRFREQVMICDKVRFLGWRSDLPRIMPHLDVFWSTSAEEGQSASILQAMASGLPIVATDIPGIRSLIRHGEHGYLCPVGLRSHFAKYSHQILNDAALARRLGQAAQQRAAADFDADQMAARCAEVYREVAV